MTQSVCLFLCLRKPLLIFYLSRISARILWPFFFFFGALFESLGGAGASSVCIGWGLKIHGEIVLWYWEKGIIYAANPHPTPQCPKCAAILTTPYPTKITWQFRMFGHGRERKIVTLLNFFPLKNAAICPGHSLGMWHCYGFYERDDLKLFFACSYQIWWMPKTFKYILWGSLEMSFWFASLFCLFAKLVDLENSL